MAKIKLSRDIDINVKFRINERNSKMRVCNEEDFATAVNRVVSHLPGIDELYTHQLNLLKLLVDKKNVFMTSPTNSGKTLPAVILPLVLKELNGLGYSDIPANGKVLFLTALNSIQESMVSSIRNLFLTCESVTASNVEELLNSDVSILFIGPEVLQTSSVSSTLLKWRQSFILKAVDEVHLCRLILILLVDS